MTLPYKSASVHVGPLRVKLAASPVLSKLVVGAALRVCMCSYVHVCVCLCVFVCAYMRVCVYVYACNCVCALMPTQYVRQ